MPVVSWAGVGGGHEVVEDAVRRGVPVVFGPRARRGSMELPDYDDEGAWAGLTVDGGWLAWLLADHTGANGQGLTLRGARILGGLNLDGLELAGRLELLDCQLGPHPIRLRDARTRTVRLHGTRCGGVDACRSHVRGALLLQGALVDGEVRLVDTRVDASVECDGARFGLGGVALDADRAQIGGSLVLRDGFTATGSVSLQAASLGGALNATGARIDHPGGVALLANDANVSGPVYLSDGFTATGMVRMQGARVNGVMTLAGGHVSNPGDDAIQLHGCRVGGSLILRHATIEGGTRLVNVGVGGDLACREANMSHPGGRALDASRAKVTGHAFLDSGFTATGAVRLTGATVGGRLQLSGATLAGGDGTALQGDGVTVGESLLLDEGFTATGVMRLVGARIGADVDCTGAQLAAPGGEHAALNLMGSRIGGSIMLRDGFVGRGGVHITRVVVAGHVDCAGGAFLDPGRHALRASGARIAGGLVLTKGFRAEGQLRMPGATIGRDLYASHCTVANPGGTALGLARIQVTGDVVLGEGFVATGRVALVRAVVGGKLDFSGGRFAHEGDPAIDLPFAQVSGTVQFDGDSVVTGQVQFRGAAITGNLDLGTGHITCHDLAAVSGTNARITGSMSLRGTVDGGARLKGVTVGGDLDCRRATLRGAVDRPSLTADRSRISGALLLSECHADGEVRLRSAEINGHATCRDSTFVNRGGAALNFANSRFIGDLLLDRGYRAEGSTWLGNVTIGNDLDCTGGHFANPGGTALHLVGAHVGGSVNLDRGFTAEGLVTLAAATVGGDVCGNGAQLADALDATGTRIAGTLSLREGFRCDGAVVLRGATAGTLHDDSGSWPETVDLDGFRYERLMCPDGDRGWRARSRWLRRQRTPSALGYVQLAAVYRASGDELWARRILVERYNALLRPPAHWRRQLPRGPLSRVWKLWRWILRYTTGHGFAPGRSVLIALPLAIVLTAWLAHARQEDMLVATDDTVAATGHVPRSSVCDDSYPCVQPFVYALDNLVPIVDLGQRSRWAPDQSHRGASWRDDGRWLAAATWVTSALGWVLATLVAASFTMSVRRD